MIYRNMSTHEKVREEDAKFYFLSKLFTDNHVTVDFLREFAGFCFGDNDNWTDTDLAREWLDVLTTPNLREGWLNEFTDWFFSGNWVKEEE